MPGGTCVVWGYMCCLGVHVLSGGTYPKLGVFVTVCALLLSVIMFLHEVPGLNHIVPVANGVVCSSSQSRK